MDELKVVCGCGTLMEPGPIQKTFVCPNCGSIVPIEHIMNYPCEEAKGEVKGE